MSSVCGRRSGVGQAAVDSAVSTTQALFNFKCCSLKIPHRVVLAILCHIHVHTCTYMYVHVHDANVYLTINCGRKI